MSLYIKLFYSQEIVELLSDNKVINKMCEFEVALANAQAIQKIIPKQAAIYIEQFANSSLVDIESIIAEIKLGGNAAIPLVKQLTRIVKNNNVEASKYVHLGVTSQDVVDTATILLIKEYIIWFELKINQLTDSLLELTKKYRNTVMIGRTLLQHAKPITFGFKAALWLTSIDSSKQHLNEIKKRLLKLQMGGAVGNGNASISKDVQKIMAEILDLNVSDSWQTSRGSLSEFAGLLAVCTGNIGKIAKDISLLMQSEVAEVFEGAAEGKGGSSTMPHKRNPVTCAAIIANAARVPHLVGNMYALMGQEHERSAGLWHAEWETLNQIMLLAAGALELGTDLVNNLEINAQRMKQNLEITKGLIYAENVLLALVGTMGKIQAHEYMEKACKLAVLQNKHLMEVLIDQKINLADLDKYFKPEYSLDINFEIIDDIIEKYGK